MIISIPASHAGGDGGNLPATSNFKAFQSPPPMREATLVYRRIVLATTISIPASHAGGDVGDSYTHRR